MDDKQERRGIGSVLEKLEKSVQDGDYYHAQQMYKTLYYRYSSKKRYKLLESMLLKGATLMLQHKQDNAGTELALLLLEHYKTIYAPVNKETIAPLLEIFSHYTNASEQQRLFIKNAINWSSCTENNNQGAPELHDVFAKFYDKEGQFGLAQTHYLRGTQPLPFSKMLIKWTLLGYESENDLYIARAVLQYLCIMKLEDSKIIFTEFQKEMKLETPLIHFLEFLLVVVEQKSTHLFKTIRENYSLSINRDDTFNHYLDILAKNYLGIETPQSSGGGLMKLMQAFMQGGRQKS